MVKITEKLLLEKGSPRTNKLDRIRTLNLSGLNLLSKDLPVSLLSQLCSLEQLDLSGNKLQELPSGLSLPRLRTLDLCDNVVEDVSSLQELSSLEELKLEGNFYLTVSDNYKVMFLLSKLKTFNGKDISSSANHLRYVQSENLRKRVEAVWEQSFSLPENSKEGKLQALEKDFIKAACSQIRYGPSSLIDYTKWRVEMLAKEHLQQLTWNGKKEQTGGSLPNSPSPAKRRNAARDAGGERESPRKRVRTAEAAITEVSPRKCSRLQATPQKTIGSVNSPRKEVPLLAKQLKLDAPKQVLKESSQKMSPVKAAKWEHVKLQPLHVLQCHSKHDNPNDFTTQLWACAFEPSLDGLGSRLVATCGGESVCIMDCETGHVLKKYKVPGEEFYCLSWSCIMMSCKSGVARPCHILAAGGKKGVVKLIHPRGNVAYAEFRPGRRALSILCFSTRHQSFLFTGGYDGKIQMWDIGGVDSDYNFRFSKLLVLEMGSTPLHLSFPPSCPDKYLLAACDNGLYCLDICLQKNKRSEKTEITFPVYAKEDREHNYHTIDGLGFATEDIVVSKCQTAGFIYLWSWSRTKCNRPNKKQEVPATILYVLQWSNTDVPYLSLNTCPGESYAVCGDDKGRLWMYCITEILKTQARSDQAIPPTKILEWPTPNRKSVGPVEGPSINSVTMDSKLRYLVVLTDKNMVVVWKRV